MSVKCTKQTSGTNYDFKMKKKPHNYDFMRGIFIIKCNKFLLIDI